MQPTIVIPRPGQYAIEFSTSAYKPAVGNGSVSLFYDRPGGIVAWESLLTIDYTFSLANTHTALPVAFGELLVTTPGYYKFQILGTNASIDTNDRWSLRLTEINSYITSGGASGNV
jgi:hypothetical protein